MREVRASFFNYLYDYNAPLRHKLSWRKIRADSRPKYTMLRIIQECKGRATSFVQMNYVI